MAQLHCTAQEDAVITAIRNLCREPETLVGFMTDTNYICDKTRQRFISFLEKIEQSDEYQKLKDYRTLERKPRFVETQDHIIKYFNESNTIVKDTIIDNLLNLRLIVFQGKESQYLTFLINKENGKWKIMTIEEQYPHPIMFSLEEFRNNFKIIDTLIKKPEKFPDYSLKSDYNDQCNSGLKRVVHQDSNLYRKFLEFAKHNYSNGYVLVSDDTTQMMYGSEVQYYIHDIYITNKEFNRPMQISFHFVEKCKKFLISNVEFYGVMDNTYRYLTFKPDTLTAKELESDWEIVKKILREPAVLKKIANDPSFSSEQFLALMSQGDNLEKIFQHIGNYFSGNNEYLVKKDIGKPAIDKHSENMEFYNEHIIVLVNKEKNKKLYFRFTDKEELYKFKLDEILPYYYMN